MKTKHDVRIDRSKLHPLLDYKLGLLLKECAKKGIYLIIAEGFRTKEYQDELFAKGRTKPGKIVTNARGNSYSSQHQWGVAFDIAINDSKRLYDLSVIKKVAKIAKSSKVGLGWGGDWKSIADTPHFYLKKWGSTTAKLKNIYGTPDRFKKTWVKRVTKAPYLVLWSDKKKVKRLANIPKGDKVDVLFEKLWFAKVKYHGVVGYVKKKYIK